MKAKYKITKRGDGRYQVHTQVAPGLWFLQDTLRELDQAEQTVANMAAPAMFYDSEGNKV